MKKSDEIEELKQVESQAVLNALPYQFNKNDRTYVAYEYDKADKAFARLNVPHGIDVISIVINPKGKGNKESIFAQRRQMAQQGPLYDYFSAAKGKRQKFVYPSGVWASAKDAAEDVAKMEHTVLNSVVFLDLVPFPTNNAADILLSEHSKALKTNLAFLKTYLDNTDDPIMLATGNLTDLTAVKDQRTRNAIAYINLQLMNTVIRENFSRLYLLGYNDGKKSFRAFGSGRHDKIRNFCPDEDVETLNCWIRQQNRLADEGKICSAYKISLLKAK